MADNVSRRQLAAFLRSRRERLSPADAGLIPGARRRTPGLRREEVALLSGVSVTWYTWLEQAREITVSHSVLAGVADALQLTRTERRHLFGLAGQPLPADGQVDPPNPTLQALVDAIDPNPAYLLNARSDILAWNRAEIGLIGDPAAFDAAERRFADLTAALREASPEFRDWWDHDVVAEFQSPRWEFDHPEHGRLAFDYVKLAANSAPDTKLVAALPADPRTAERVAELAKPIERAHQNQID